jgi:hypothetical protein
MEPKIVFIGIIATLGILILNNIFDNLIKFVTVKGKND